MSPRILTAPDRVAATSFDQRDVRDFAAYEFFAFEFQSTLETLAIDIRKGQARRVGEQAGGRCFQVVATLAVPDSMCVG